MKSIRFCLVLASLLACCHTHLAAQDLLPGQLELPLQFGNTSNLDMDVVVDAKLRLSKPTSPNCRSR